MFTKGVLQQLMGLCADACQGKQERVASPRAMHVYLAPLTVVLLGGSFVAELINLTPFLTRKPDGQP